VACAGDVATIAELLADDVSYHDMIYEEAFEGKEEMVDYLNKVHFLSLSHTHTHTLSLSLSHIHSHSLSRPFSLVGKCTKACSHSLSCPQCPVCEQMQVMKMVPRDLQFIMDDITTGDDRKVGIMW
jgi:hypothetical protein